MGAVQDGCERINESGVAWVFCLIDGFGGLVVGEVEFAGDCLPGLPVAPFSVTAGGCSNAVAHGLWESGGCPIIVGRSGVLGDSGWLSGCCRILEDGQEADAFEVGRVGELAEMVEGGEEIDEFGDGRGGLSGGILLGVVNEEWHSSIKFKSRCFTPEHVFADVIAVVAEEDDDGAISDPGCIECIQDFSELRIHVGNVGKVAMAHFGHLCRGGLLLIVCRAKDFGALMKCDIGGIFGSGINRLGQFGAIVQVPVFPRCIEVGMWFPEANGKEELL